MHRSLILPVMLGLLTILESSYTTNAVIEAVEPPTNEAVQVDFESQILPLFRDRCYACHGPKLQESNFRLDSKQVALGVADFGIPPIVAGNSIASPLMQYVAHQQEGLEMPPLPEQQLTPEEILLLGNWIDQGADWPDALAGAAEGSMTTDHWSFQPVVRPPIPLLDQSWGKGAWEEGAWGEGPIDAFVVARLRAAGLQPSAEADPGTLIRRLYLDVLGLLPSPSEVEAFVQDNDPAAYENLVDRILASPDYGQRWASHWFDVVRFAESDGFEMNWERPNAYRYRDYVIAALNMDKAYDKFIADQIAGDATGAPQATGFLVGGAFDRVKGNAELNLMQRHNELDDMINTTGTTFLGLTIGCARCHNHKFDPILQKDYYAMQAVFAGVQHGERVMETVVEEENLRQVAELDTAIAQAERQWAQSGAMSPINARRNLEVFAPHRARWVRFTISATNTGTEPCVDELEIFTLASKEAPSRNVALASGGAIATASSSLAGSAIHKLEHIHDGLYGNSRSWISGQPGEGQVQIELPEHATIDRVVWGRDRDKAYSDRVPSQYVIEVADEPQQWRTVVDSRHRNEHGNQQQQQLAAELDAKLQQLSKQRAALLDARQIVAYAGTFQPPGETRLMYRGDPLSPRDAVAPDALTVLGTLGLELDTPEQQRRMALADWITAPENPLTARVMVNRVWHYHFGTGLVSTPSDFGTNGGRPSHPKLLDWLACEFMANGWSIKHLQRQILLSSTYRQSSAPRRAAQAVDSGCRLLWRFPPRRLEAEAIHDCMLQAAGMLDRHLQGPGYSAFEPTTNYVRNYVPKAERGPDQWRRMVYMQKIRMEEDAVFGAFDCPDGGQIAPRRQRSTTPLQALNLLNSPLVIQLANHLAARLEREAPADVGAQVQRAFRLALSRQPTAEELADSVVFTEQHGLPSLCRAIFNSNESVFLP